MESFKNPRNTKLLSAIIFSVLILFAPFVVKAGAPVYGYAIVNTYPHDPEAFTQGLALDEKILYEGTGLYGKSTLRKVDLKTGKVTKRHKLSADHFGEGITVVGDHIIQLTWQSKKGFIYNKNSFRVVREFGYATEGWGITYDGRYLIMSDGTAFLQILDPKTYKLVKMLPVTEEGRLIGNLNELEWAEGEIVANVWGRDVVARISPQTGEVRGWIDLTGLRQRLGDKHKAEALNGIAYNTRQKTFLVTGKNWPKLFEIQILKSRI